MACLCNAAVKTVLRAIKDRKRRFQTNLDIARAFVSVQFISAAPFESIIKVFFMQGHMPAWTSSSLIPPWWWNDPFLRLCSFVSRPIKYSPLFIFNGGKCVWVHTRIAHPGWMSIKCFVPPIGVGNGGWGVVGNKLHCLLGFSTKHHRSATGKC